ncbi:MAG: PhoH family protein [Deltaproteobacteria bacterium]|nr:PhoH family protein [Deltaproteobacteria bacterium]
MHVPDDHLRANIAGVEDSNLRVLSKALGMKVVHRGQDIVIHADGRDPSPAIHALEQLHGMARRGFTLHATDVERVLSILGREPDADVGAMFLDTVFVSAKGRPVAPRGPGQKVYLDSIRVNDITVGVGPAGTGKTYLAMAAAVAALTRRKVHRIVLTRPAVEAGERLGFLPGDLEAKVNPYLRPLYDALHDLMGFDESQLLMQKGVVEVAPLAFMRGRTLNDSFVILDEAQNTTPEQMKMFLTRLGFGSKAVVTGDLTQVDLPSTRQSGLTDAVRVLQDVAGVGTCFLTEKDIVRHPVVQAIVQAYDRDDARRATEKRPPDEPRS